VRLGRGPRAEDRYGRSLFYAFTQDRQSIDETLVREGLALARTRDGQHWDVLAAAEGDPDPVWIILDPSAPDVGDPVKAQLLQVIVNVGLLPIARVSPWYRSWLVCKAERISSGELPIP